MIMLPYIIPLDNPLSNCNARNEISGSLWFVYLLFPWPEEEILLRRKFYLNKWGDGFSLKILGSFGDDLVTSVLTWAPLLVPFLCSFTHLFIRNRVLLTVCYVLCRKTMTVPPLVIKVRVSCKSPSPGTVSGTSHELSLLNLKTP